MTYGYDQIEVAEVLNEFGCDSEVIREYDLEIESVRIIRGALRIKTPSGYRMMKRLVGSPQKAKFLFQVLEHVHASFPNVPRFIRNKYTDPFVVHETGIYYLSDWLPGREADFRKVKNLILAAQALAHFHTATKGFAESITDLPQQDDFVNGWTTAHSRLDSYLEISQNRVETTPFEDLFEYVHPYLVRMIEHACIQGATEYYRRILSGAREARAICHGSFVRQNVVIDGGRVSLIDFGHCHPGIAMEDLGYLLNCYMPNFDWDFEVGKSIIEAYTSEREVPKLDLHALSLYLCFPTRPVSIIQSFYEGSRDWEMDRYCAELQKALIDEEGREEFVQYLVDTYGLDLVAPDFAYEINLDEEEGLSDLESSSFQTGFMRGSGWQSDLNQALETARRAVSQAEQMESLTVSPEEVQTVSDETSAQDETDPIDPTVSTYHFRDAAWVTAVQDQQAESQVTTPKKSRVRVPVNAKRPKKRKARRLEDPSSPQPKSLPGIWLKERSFLPKSDDTL